ncbi:MAG: class I SAM-dependent methyltransferase [Nitrospirae bacterium]|uniref:class I SAM-dependent methyltransferase n=1 Tax=Candidatus Magnetobacterium casense TaxID=1455061 RepID=UPI00058F6978|nr:class I SAM-dependent methyltransferase [Candidatus Magnetobacterium casensis]MBF0338548.1 class I SAM-dependent methyltransferase [Nitrospirota bacterium]
MHGRLNQDYDKAYYAAREQDDSRIALRFYARIVKSYVNSGRVLDYGCGTGHFIKQFTRGYESHAYDVSPYALEAVRNLNGGIHICTEPAALQEGFFDLITAIHVLEHIAEPFEVLAMFASLLREGGVVFFVVPNPSGLGHWLRKGTWTGYGDPSHVSLLPSKTWIELTRKAGLRILKTGTDGLWDVPYIKDMPVWIQKLIFYPLPALQVLTGQLFLPHDSGESLVVIAQKRS